MTLYTIYKITNNINDEIYVGSTRMNIQVRLHNHICQINSKQHMPLYSAMLEHGKENFSIIEIESKECETIKDAHILEQSYISELSPSYNSIKAHTTKFEKNEQNKIRMRINGKERYIKSKDRVNTWKANNEERVKTVKALIYQKNKASIKAKMKETYEKKKEIRTCLCGSTYDYGTKSTRDTHFKTIKHREHVILIHQHLGLI
jgi:group I intron endonuclease